MTGQTQSAPAPHFPQTEFLPGPVITAACPCGWRKIASSHEHAVALGDEHRAEVGAVSSPAEADMRERLGVDLPRFVRGS